MSGVVKKHWTLPELRRADEALTKALPMSLFDTLADVTASDVANESVALALRLAGQENGHPELQGQASVTLPMVCQRCLEPMRFELVATVKAAFLQDEGESVAEGFDAWLVPEAGVVLRDVIEEALLMALPLAPKHADADCEVRVDPVAVEKSSEKRSPFAGLRKMLDEQ